MAKPILIIKLPWDIQPEAQEEIRNDLSKRDITKDYYFLSFIGQGNEEAEFQVFYEKDFNEVKYEELKKIIKDSINK